MSEQPQPLNILRVNILCPEDSVIQKAKNRLVQHGVVIFPAHCLYGVAANALDPRAVERVFLLKQRPKNNPLLVLVKDLDSISPMVKSIPDPAKRLMENFWPGRLTIVFEAADHICPLLTAQTGKIGIRLPGHPVARALVEAVDFPVTGTSANLSGEPGCTQTCALDPSIITNADLILDAGRLQGGAGSTIVDVSAGPVKILRHGSIPARQILACLG
ncbi:MAG: threonylcarbamoyl-AMP synthase [Desulfobacter sp.]|nr:MAG: threonylcarbamoyl-AMP synthase [Desulfobacter sp.]